MQNENFGRKYTKKMIDEGFW